MNSNIDKTDEVDEKELEKALDKNLLLSNDLKDIQDSNIYIITVPTQSQNQENLILAI